jgi:ArsR family transcriptional regulator
VECINLYKCLADMQRLRILNLLQEGPLCVCHLQEILEETQVKMSKQLAYMKKLGVVTAAREGAWMIYRLPEASHPIVTKNLQCLRDCSDEHPVLSTDLERRAHLIQRIQRGGSTTCPGAVAGGGE